MKPTESRSTWPCGTSMSSRHYVLIRICCGQLGAALSGWCRCQSHVRLTCLGCRHQVLCGAQLGLTTLLGVALDGIVAAMEESVGKYAHALQLTVAGERYGQVCSSRTRGNKGPKMPQHPRHWVSLLGRVLWIPPAPKHSSCSALCLCTSASSPIRHLLQWRRALLGHLKQ